MTLKSWFRGSKAGVVPEGGKNCILQLGFATRIILDPDHVCVCACSKFLCLSSPGSLELSGSCRNARCARLQQSLNKNASLSSAPPRAKMNCARRNLNFFSPSSRARFFRQVSFQDSFTHDDDDSNLEMGSPFRASKNIQRAENQFATILRPLPIPLLLSSSFSHISS